MINKWHLPLCETAFLFYIPLQFELFQIDVQHHLNYGFNATTTIYYKTLILQKIPCDLKNSAYFDPHFWKNSSTYTKKWPLFVGSHITLQHARVT
jgi:hypothetical protein